MGLIIGEATLHNAYGGPAVLASQLEHLLGLAARGMVVQLLTHEAVATIPPVPDVTALSFNDGSRDIAYTASLGAHRPVAGEDSATARYHLNLLRSAALAPSVTTRLLREAVAGLRDVRHAPPTPISLDCLNLAATP